MGKPLTPAQEKIRDAQISKNEEYIVKVDSLLHEIELFYKETNDYNTYLVELYEKLIFIALMYVKIDAIFMIKRSL